ncbi:TPA_asm: hypothetical protein GNB21_000760 [Salmonella enterica subsp. indica serovar 41:b:1,7]|nr:hypothetical protein [Salmonella enterica subsp. indica serovar 41:b:1,7]
MIYPSYFKLYVRWLPRSPQSLTRVSAWGLMRDILVPHRRQPPAVQIRSRRICHGVAAFLQLELFRVYRYKP